MNIAQNAQSHYYLNKQSQLCFALLCFCLYFTLLNFKFGLRLLLVFKFVFAIAMPILIMQF